MKTKLILLICITILLATKINAQAQASSWARYTVKGEEFSVTFPVEPAMQTSEVFVPRIQKGRQQRVLEVKAGDVTYRVYVYENPKPRQSLQDFITEQTARSDVDLTFDSDLKVGNVSGKQYSSRDRDLPSTEQFFATEERLYRFVARGATADHADARRFFSSVLLGKKQDGIEVLESPGGGVGPGPYASTSPVNGIGPEVYIGKDVDTRARLITKPEPQYTAQARNHKVEGTVILKVVFSASGKVTNIRVVQALPDGLTERAIEAARKIEFVPATKEGKYVSMWMQLEYNFNLH